MAQRVYGDNHIFCKGRLIAGPDARNGIASFVMVLVPSSLFVIKVGEFFWEKYSPAVLCLGLVLEVGSLVLLILTIFSDPGIVPRQQDFKEHFDAASKLFRQKPPPRYQDIVLNGFPFKLKYCTTCNVYRPPRCTHCSVCDNCVERFDHHCPWVGNCIGKRNYWLFYSFVTTTGVLTLFVLLTSVIHLSVVCNSIIEESEEEKGTGDAFLESLQQEPISAFLIVYTVAIVWFTVGLCMYHSYLICTNQTTYEQIKGVYSVNGNPFNKGVVGNCRGILCTRIRPRYFDPHTNKTLRKQDTADTRDIQIEFRSQNHRAPVAVT